MKTIWLSLWAFVFTFSVFAAKAQEPALAGRDYDETREAQVAQKARKRLYPGGKDETDLKVQTQWTNPARKLAPNMEISNSNAAEPAEPAAED